MRAEAFERWLKEKGYAQASRRKAVTDIGTIVTHGPVPPESQRQRVRLRDYCWAWKLYTAFVEETGAPALSCAAPQPMPAPTVGPRLKREGKRLHEAISIDDREWARFSRTVAADTDIRAITIHVMCDTGLRISDVLHVTSAHLSRGFARSDRLTEITVKGSKPVIVDLSGAEEAWQRLHAVLLQHPQGLRLAQVISPKSDPEAIVSGAAYHAVRRYLAELAEKTQLSGRVHLHRLRRTVTVQVLRAGGSLEEAQQVLLHDSKRTTERNYADEVRAHDAAAALRRARERRQTITEDDE